MSPTVLRVGPYRFFFFSREERRTHVHVQSQDDEAKPWLDPSVEIATSHGFGASEQRKLRDLVREREDVIRDAWDKHFGS